MTFIINENAMKTTNQKNDAPHSKKTHEERQHQSKYSAEKDSANLHELNNRTSDKSQKNWNFGKRNNSMADES